MLFVESLLLNEYLGKKIMMKDYPTSKEINYLIRFVSKLSPI